MQNLPHHNHAKSALVSLIALGLITVIPLLLPHYGLATSFYSEWAAFALGLAACFPLLSRNFWLHLTIPQSAVWLSALVVLIALQAPLVGDAALVDEIAEEAVGARDRGIDLGIF